MRTSDFLIIGGGIVGISIAREIKRRFPGCSVILIEKEKECAKHASGRNSGVLHAGFYYSKDTLKAKLTQTGNQSLTQYCLEKNLPINRCGKLVVAQNANDLPILDELLRRGMTNGVPLEEVSEAEAKKIEPRVKTFERAIFSPTTSSVDPVQVCLSMKSDAKQEGIEIITDAQYLRKEKSGVLTSAGVFEAGFVINCAGLYADKVALDYGFSEEYRILPFKGLYLYSDEPAGSFRTHIYPVPDIRNPFLGVHVTVTVDQHAKIGPTAIPAFWREQYKGFDRFRFEEFLDITWREAGLFFSSGFDFTKLAFSEITKYSKSKLVRLASSLAQGIHFKDYQRWGKAGIRAQLLNIKTKKLEMDFVIQGDDKSIHILNAVSPGFTCSIPFARHVVDEVERKIACQVSFPNVLIGNPKLDPRQKHSGMTGNSTIIKELERVNS